MWPLHNKSWIGLFWPLSTSKKTDVHTNLWSSFFSVKAVNSPYTQSSASTGGGVLFQVSVLFSTENAKGWPILAILSQIYAPFGVLIQAAVVYQNWLISGTRPQSLLCHKYLKGIHFDDNPFSEKKICLPYSVERMIDVTTEFTWKAAGGGERRPGCLWRQHFLAATLKPKNSSRIITGLTYIGETFEK